MPQHSVCSLYRHPHPHQMCVRQLPHQFCCCTSGLPYLQSHRRILVTEYRYVPSLFHRQINLCGWTLPCFQHRLFRLTNISRTTLDAPIKRPLCLLVFHESSTPSKRASMPMQYPVSTCHTTISSYSAAFYTRSPSLIILRELSSRRVWTCTSRILRPARLVDGRDQ